jgi:hypothetical protein
MKSGTWAFLIDILLAGISILDVPRLHGALSTYIVYAVVFGLLRWSDAVAIRRGWHLPGRIAVKVLIVVFARALVLVSAMERCDITGSNCHRVFF